jgi:hypothetical protein
MTQWSASRDWTEGSTNCAIALHMACRVGLRNGCRRVDSRAAGQYVHGDDGSGLGASHQTGWTALVAELINSGA